MDQDPISFLKEIEFHLREKTHINIEFCGSTNMDPIEQETTH